MASKSPFVLIHGHVKLFVNDPGLLEQALQALGPALNAKSELEGQDSYLSTLAEISSLMVNYFSKKFPDVQYKGLRDVIFRHKRDLAPRHLAFLKQLNMAFSLMRHTSTFSLKRQAEDILKVFDEHSSNTVGSQPDMDTLCDAAGLTSLLRCHRQCNHPKSWREVLRRLHRWPFSRQTRLMIPWATALLAWTSRRTFPTPKL